MEMSRIFKESLPATNPEKSLKKANRGNRSNRLAALEEKYAERISARKTHLMGLVDATGSMSSVWNQTRKIITELIAKVSEIGDFHMNWVAYRDYDLGNQLLEYSGWYDKPEPLIDFVKKINCIANSTSDEAVEAGLKFAAHDQKCTRIILIGDAPPHPERDYRDQAAALAKQGRKVFSFVVGSYPRTIEAFTEISQITGGACHMLTSVDEILACVALTAAEEMGGEKAVQKMLEGFRSEHKALSPGIKKFADKLLNPPK